MLALRCDARFKPLNLGLILVFRYLVDSKYGNFDISFPAISHAIPSAPSPPAHAVTCALRRALRRAHAHRMLWVVAMGGCYGWMLLAHAHRMLIGVCNPMLCPDPPSFFLLFNSLFTPSGSSTRSAAPVSSPRSQVRRIRPHLPAGARLCVSEKVVFSFALGSGPNLRRVTTVASVQSGRG